MRRSRRALVVCLSAAGLVASAAGCSDSGSSSTTLAPIGPTTTTGASTTTIVTTTTARTSTTVAATTTSAGATTTAATPTTAGGGSTYESVAGPNLPSVTTAIDPSWIDANGETLDRVADGSYWATADGTATAPRASITLHLEQAFFHDACIQQFGSGDDACDNDYGLLEQPSGSYPAYVADAEYVTVVDEQTKQSYLIDSTELFALVNGQAPSSPAPAPFFYVPFPFLVAIRNGAVISLEQVWVP
jgi:hypothetical protein